MTVSSTTRKAGPFAGNGVVTTFPFAFKVFAKTDIQAVLTDPTGIDTPLTVDSNYSVTLSTDQTNSPGGTVTYPITGTPLPAGYKLTIAGDLENLQPTDITNAGGFYPQVIEDALDRAVIQIQQLAEEMSRTIRVSVSDLSTGQELPPAAQRANKTLIFDGGGNPALSLQAYVDPTVLLNEATAIAEKLLAGITTPTFNNFVPDLFVAGVDYTPGTSTSVTLPATTTLKTIAGVFFDAAFQSRSQWQLGVDNVTLTFNGAIPQGVGEINVAYLTPALLGSFIQSGFGAATRTFQDKARETLAITDFPMIGVSSQDDTTAVQDAINVALQTGRPVNLPFDRDVYITRPIDIKPRSAPSTYPGQVGIHYARAMATLLRGQGGRAIKAAPNFVGNYMLQFIFDAGNGWIAPMWSSLEDFILDGAGVVNTALISNYCMNLQLRRMRATGVNTAFQFIGYGVAQIDRCNAFAQVCVDLSQGGGDSTVTAGDFYPISRGILIGPSGGDFTVRDTVFTRQDADFPSDAQPIAVASTTTTSEIRDVRVINCEFSGMQMPVSLAGSAGFTVKRVVIEGCHTTPSAGGALWTGALAHLENVQSGRISGNFVGFPGLPPTSGAPLGGVGMIGCKNIGMVDNGFEYLTNSALVATNCSNLNFDNNRLNNVAMVDGTGTAIFLENTINSSVSCNTAQKTETIAGATFISEIGTSTGNKGVGNVPTGFATFASLAPGSTSSYS